VPSCTATSRRSLAFAFQNTFKSHFSLWLSTPYSALRRCNSAAKDERIEERSDLLTTFSSSYGSLFLSEEGLPPCEMDTR
jgi:hypothetical protein